MKDMPRYACTGCARTDLSITANGGLRAHAADSKKITPDNPACSGSGQQPRLPDAGEPPTDHHEGRSACRVCRMPYPLTANGRIRSHLDRGAPNADGTQPNCPGGSDWPLGVTGIGSDGFLTAVAENLDLPHDVATSGDGSWLTAVAESQATDPDSWGGDPDPKNPSAAAHAGAVVHTLRPGDRNRDDADAFLGGGAAGARGNGSSALPSADEFLSGDQEETEEDSGPAPWFDSRYDGTCATCGTHFDSGDRIRSDGSGGWEAEDCCGNADDHRPAAARPPVTASLQLPVRRGRYVGPHPETGQETRWTRTTNFAESVADSIALDQWKGRMTVMGLALRNDLVSKVRSMVQGQVPHEVAKSSRDDLNAVVEQAKEAAGSKTRAKKGTLLHKHTEEVNSGRRTVADIPEEFRPDVAAYVTKLEAAGFRPVRHLIERSVVCLDLGVVGTFDGILEVLWDQETADVNGRPVRLKKGEFVIGDTKSGASLEFPWKEIQIQLSVYAHAANENGVAVPVRGPSGKPVWAWSPLAEQGVLPVREDIGIVVHIPYGEAHCELYYADLIEGWRGAKLCQAVRSWRSPAMTSKRMDALRVAVPSGPQAVTVPPAAGYDRPVAAQLAGHPSVAAPGTTDTAPAGDAWEERFRAVTDKEAASALWREARASGVSPEALGRLTALVSLKPQVPVSRPNGHAPVQPVAGTPREALAPVQPPAGPTLEERARSVKSKAEASAIFQEMRRDAVSLGRARIAAVVEIMKEALTPF